MTATALPTAFRFSDLDLRDPHVFVRVLFTCSDATDRSVAGQPSFNQQVQDSITLDTNNDGFLDLSLLAIFRPRDQVSPTGNVDLAEGQCTAPVSSTSCGLKPMGPREPTTYQNRSSGTCLAPFPGTTSGYRPPITTPLGPCFVTAPVPLVITVQGTPVPLRDAQIAATWVGNPATAARDGLVRAFLNESDADAAMVDLGALGIVPLSQLLPGGRNSCARGNDKDRHPDGTPGWWFHLNFPAVEVPYTGP